jgi:dUTP pyrophosphatase
MNTGIIQIQQLSPDAVVPKYGSLGSAGFDLVATEDVTIEKGKTALIPLGFAAAIPEGHYVRIESRSGMALKGLVVLTGVIDSDYRGEWKVILHNLCASPGNAYRIAKGDRVAQGVMRPYTRAAFDTVSDLGDTQRGAGGFGSTGTR